MKGQSKESKASEFWLVSEGVVDLAAGAQRRLVGEEGHPGSCLAGWSFGRSLEGFSFVQWFDANEFALK